MSAAEALYLSCHCQNHVLQVHHPGDGTQDGVEALMKLAMVCDCSICIKGRGIWVHVDKLPTSKITLEVKKGFGKDGGDELVEYSFGRKTLAYQSCRKCGTSLCIKYGSAQPTKEGGLYCLNVSDLFSINGGCYCEYWGWAEERVDTSVDEPKYAHVTLDDIPGAVEYLTPRKAVYDYPTEIYAGSCHCKRICFAVLCRPLDEVSVLDCTCSICRGNGTLWIYPGRRNVYFAHPSSPSKPWGADASLKDGYVWGGSRVENWTCKTCKCTVYWSAGDDEDPVPEKALGREETDREKEVERVGRKEAYRWNQGVGG